MNTSRKGTRLEHSVRDLFREAGYSVIRGAGSKGEMLGNKVDLIATKETPLNEYEVLLVYIVGVRCKARRRPPS